MTPQARERYRRGLLARVDVETRGRVGREFTLPVTLDLPAVFSMVGNLQLALRVPENSGPGASTARAIVDGIIDRLEAAGLIACGELARLGYNEEWDE